MIIMIGATVITILTGDTAMAMFPLLVGIFCVFVVYGRSGRAPLSAGS
jgi:hypothetical protein